MNIKAGMARNSKQRWSVKAEINGVAGIAPEGSSKGSYEAKDVDTEKAKEIVEKIKYNFIGKEFSQESFDAELCRIDGTNDFSGIGGNTSTALSFAFFNLNFQMKTPVFPFPLGNVFGGGKHGGFSDIQEFLIISHEAKTVQEAVENNIRFYEEFGRILKSRAKIDNNIEGAFTAKIGQDEVFELLSELSEDIPVKLGIDVAASEFWNGEKYDYRSLGKQIGSGENVDFLKDLAEKYNLFYIEDAFHEDDFSDFTELNKKIGNKILVCGDDLTVTNVQRMKMALEKKSINSIIIKPNQIGTVSLARDAMTLAVQNGITPVISHRSGETFDTTISRIAVNWEIPMIKIGFNEQDRAKMDELINLAQAVESPKMAKLPKV